MARDSIGPDDAILQNVPNCKRPGLLDASGGWLRTKFTEWASSAPRTTPTRAGEYEIFRSPAADRRLDRG
jgi:hypothetical protein